MSETASRLLRLLAFLQTYRHWSGTELADELGVSTRTVRRDVDRLRQLGYPVEASQGSAGYRLGAGAELPPLLLDDDEAVAVAIGLRTATAAAIAGIEDSSLRALAKLQQVLPSRLRHRVSQLERATAEVRLGSGATPVDSEVLLRIAEAVNRSEGLRFDYTAHAGAATVRTVEPHTMVSWGRRWYLVAWDLDRQGWRTFRIDRLRPKLTPGDRFEPRPPPDGDAVAYLSRQLSTGPWAIQATVTLHAPADAVADKVWPGMGAIEAVDRSTCLLHLGAESIDELPWMITALGVDFTVTEPPVLVAAIAALGDRCRRAVASTGGHDG